jgi:hypothetical protein
LDEAKNAARRRREHKYPEVEETGLRIGSDKSGMTSSPRRGRAEVPNEQAKRNQVGALISAGYESVKGSQGKSMIGEYGKSLLH